MLECVSVCGIRVRMVSDCFAFGIVVVDKRDLCTCFSSSFSVVICEIVNRQVVKIEKEEGRAEATKGTGDGRTD